MCLLIISNFTKTFNTQQVTQNYQHAYKLPLVTEPPLLIAANSAALSLSSLVVLAAGTFDGGWTAGGGGGGGAPAPAGLVAAVLGSAP